MIIRKFTVAAAMFARLQLSTARSNIDELIRETLSDKEFAERLLQQCEKLTAVA